ncbi:GTP-dependent dephospho-CoA kinase family protein [Halomarina rubra]|uniref:GTP-dependent dephospho-CoA kinase n=1 Tax=Halomarina rubra TaxID=2071873 RepID=A0ABD6AVI9_9EURY|nr:GTP-dependent dephospho-CoA kinase family protein [Halomarina rubra]
MLDLPDDLRAELKEPVGPLYTDPAELLADAGRPLVAVGDVVTDHLLDETTPDVAFVDGQTKRTELPADRRIDTDAFERVVRVENPAATLSRGLLVALADALDSEATTLVLVDGEEDLAAVPAIAAAPDGASVVYGQPDEGMVHVRVDEETRTAMRDFLARMDGDREGAYGALGVT